jgi:hypothetical protein
MYFGDRLDLDSEILKGLRSEIEVSLCAALMLADKEGKEIEVGIKVKVKTETVRTYNEGKVSREWEEPRISWNVSRKKKEDKIDYKGSARAGWELRFDNDGRPYVVEVNKQMSLLNEPEPTTVIHYHFGEKKEAELEENTVMPPYAQEDPEVKENDPTDATLDDDGSGYNGDSAPEQPDNATEATDAEGAE